MEKLPCDVLLPPATIIRKGCDISTLMAALEVRERHPDKVRPIKEFWERRTDPEPPPKHDLRISN